MRLISRIKSAKEELLSGREAENKKQDHADRSRKIWDRYAPVYKIAMRADEKIYRFMYHRIPQLIEGKDVLELATGPGMIAKHVASAADKMIATDFSPQMIKEAKKGAYPDNLTFEVADAADLPYEDDSFDVVLIANALHVVPDPEAVLSEIDRVLKKKGILIAPNFIEHQKGMLSRAWSSVLSLAGVSFEHQWTEEEYCTFLEKNGWKIINKKKMSARISILYTECIRTE